MLYVPCEVKSRVGIGSGALFPAGTDEDWAAHPEYLDDEGALVASVGGLLVERDGRALLIDAGVGPVSLPAQPGNLPGAIEGGALPGNLTALGGPPVEAVAITHLHLDHIGWAATFPEVLLTDVEWAHRDQAEAHGTPGAALDAMAPKVRTVKDGEEVFPGVRVRLTPGHTTGHAVYEITAGDQRVLAFGDAMHSAVQVGHPDWSATFDRDLAETAHYRHRLVAELARPDSIGFGIHFADATFGRARPTGDGHVWEPIDTG